MNLQTGLKLASYSAFEQTYKKILKLFGNVVNEKTDEIINKLNNSRNVTAWVLQQAAEALQEMNRAVDQLTGQVKERLLLQIELNWLQNRIVESEFNSLRLTQLGDTLASLHNNLWQFIRLQVPVIELKWVSRKSGRATEEFCALTISYNPYALCTDPLWSVSDTGMQVPSSEGMAVDQLTGNIYVAGYRHQGIKVFNQSGRYLTSFLSEMLEFAYDVCCIANYLYVTTVRDIVKVDKATGKVLISRKLGFESGGTALDKDGNVFVCHCTQPRVTVFDASLTNCRSISLKIQGYNPNKTLTRCICLTPEEMFILFENSPYAVQTFSYKGKLKRCVLPENKVEKASDFCLDNQSNILINELSGRQIKIFNKSGNLIQCIEKTSYRQNNRTNIVTRGLFVNEWNRIITSLPRAANFIQVY